MTASPVTCEIDFAAEGRQQGFIRVPHSVTRSAYGFVPVPVISVRRGAGPKVVLMAGNHGDEFEGQVALTRLASSLDVDDVAGQLVILPAANTPAAVAARTLACTMLSTETKSRDCSPSPKIFGRLPAATAEAKSGMTAEYGLFGSWRGPKTLK